MAMASKPPDAAPGLGRRMLGSSPRCVTISYTEGTSCADESPKLILIGAAPILRAISVNQHVRVSNPRGDTMPFVLTGVGAKGTACM